MNHPPALTEDLTPTPLISFNEALQYFQTTDLGDFLVRNCKPKLLRYMLLLLALYWYK